jgi:hypothetical protein
MLKIEIDDEDVVIETDETIEGSANALLNAVMTICGQFKSENPDSALEFEDVFMSMLEDNYDTIFFVDEEVEQTTKSSHLRVVH